MNNGRCELSGCCEEEDSVFAAAGRRRRGPGSGPTETAGQWTGAPRESETSQILFLRLLTCLCSALLSHCHTDETTLTSPHSRLWLLTKCNEPHVIDSFAGVMVPQCKALVLNEKSLDSCRSGRMRSAVWLTGLCESTVNNVDHVDSTEAAVQNWIHLPHWSDYFLFTEIMSSFQSWTHFDEGDGVSWLNVLLSDTSAGWMCAKQQLSGWTPNHHTSQPPLMIGK